MKKFKYFDWILFFIIIILVVFLARSTNHVKQYKQEKQEFQQRIDSMERSYDRLQESFILNEKKLDTLQREKSGIEARLEQQENNIKQLRRKYEKKINDLFTIPDDSLYRQNTGWLDSISIHR